MIQVWNEISDSHYGGVLTFDMEMRGMMRNGEKWNEVEWNRGMDRKIVV